VHANNHFFTKNCGEKPSQHFIKPPTLQKSYVQKGKEQNCTAKEKKLQEGINPNFEELKVFVPDSVNMHGDFMLELSGPFPERRFNLLKDSIIPMFPNVPIG
jgi:hypothetical protein